MSPWRRASASASMATTMCASRWSRTSTASARRRATSSASLLDGGRHAAQRRSAQRPPLTALDADRQVIVSETSQDRIMADALQDRHCRARAPSAPRSSAILQERSNELADASAAGRSTITAVSARDRTRDRGIDLAGIDLVRRSGRAGRERRHRRLRRTDRRRGRPGRRAAVEAALARGLPCRHRQQGAARRARRRAGRDRRGEGRAPQLRGGGRRRHSGHQDDARIAGRQHVSPRLRHPERHLQLHPDPDGDGRHLLRRLPRRTPSASAMPKPIRPSTSRATTPPTSWRS